MGLFDWLFGRNQTSLATRVEYEEQAPPPAATTATAPPQSRSRVRTSKPEPVKSKPTRPEPEKAAKIVPPPQTELTEEWALKLCRYAKRVSRELAGANVATYTNQDFWLIAVDVNEAIWHRPVRHGQIVRLGLIRDGLAYGRGLLLFRNGALVSSEVFGYFDFEHHLQSFDKVSGSFAAFKDDAWGANNFAHWSSSPKNGFLRRSDATVQEFFDGRWNYGGQEKPPGLGTSLALKRFMESHKTQLPRNYQY